MPAPARFDHLTPGGAPAFELVNCRAELTATSVEEVSPLLEEVAAASADGYWAAGYVAYSAAPAFDDALQVRPRPLGDPFAAMPLVWFGIYEESRPAPRLQWRRSRPVGYGLSPWNSSITGEEHAAAVADIGEAIGRGETYQVNHTFRLRAAFSGDPSQLYRDLVVAQRGAYGAFLDLGRFQVASASPERFFRLRGNHVDVRPMKGASRRGRWRGEDEELATALTGSESQQAANLMLVDMLRSDLGRIARPGTVKLEEMFTLEGDDTRWILSSQVGADLADGNGLAEIFAALFPAGSATGAPRASTMVLIRDLEPTGRGIHGGAVGFVAPAGHEAGAHFSLAVRTVVVDSDEGFAEHSAGGTVTWDSAAPADYEQAVRTAGALQVAEEDFALLETLRLEDGSYLFLDEHLERLADSAAFFGFTFDEHEVRSALTKHAATAMVAEEGACRVRLVMDRRGAVEVATEAPGLLPFVADPADLSFGMNPVHVTLAEQTIDRRDIRLFHNTTRRRPYLATRTAAAAVDDVILINGRGAVTEATIANLALRFEDVWLTPPLDEGCLPGVFRGVLLAAGKLEEAPIPVDDLAAADDVAVINSVYGWRRAVVVPRTGYTGRDR